MSARRLFVDRGLGETRGVVTLDGRAERLVIRREGDEPRLLLGARLAARVESVEAAIATAFLDLGGGCQAVLPFRPDQRPVRGATVDIEIRSEPRDGKLATARLIGPAEGAPRLLEPAPDMMELLRRLTREGDAGPAAQARDVADAAEAEALEILHPLPGGGTLAIEPTRALTAVDVDVGDRKGADAKRVTRQANLTALSEAARLLRLKGLGGLVVLDLAGRGHDGAALLAAARLAFAPDNPGVSIGPVGRFGTMELSIPRRTRPVLEQLRDPDGALSVAALGHRLIRRLEAEAQARPGDRLRAVCAPAVAAAAAGPAQQLAERIGARFAITPDPGSPRERLDVSAA